MGEKLASCVGEPLDAEAKLRLGRRKCISVPMLRERRIDPGDGGILGSMDRGRGVFLLGSGLLGDDAAELKSIFVGD